MNTVIQHSASCSHTSVIQFPVKSKPATFPACGFDRLDCQPQDCSACPYRDLPQHTFSAKSQAIVSLLEKSKEDTNALARRFHTIKNESLATNLAEAFSDLTVDLTIALAFLRELSND